MLENQTIQAICKILGIPKPCKKCTKVQTTLLYFFRSAYFHYAADERPKVREANPSFAVGDIAKELGRRWSDADPSLKAKYEAKAEKDRERYIKEKEDFQKLLQEEKNGILSKNKTEMKRKWDSDEEEEEAAEDEVEADRD